MKDVTMITVGNVRSHKRFCQTMAGISSFLMLTTFSAPAFAVGTSVLGNDATLMQATGANLAKNTDDCAKFVSTGGASAVLDWSKFNIGANHTMEFSGAGTTFFNLVSGTESKSQIDGIISGNGSVWVINPNGIAFGANSQVNVGGTFAAAAGNISNAEALKGGVTIPTFASFGGNVELSGTKFTGNETGVKGNQVVLMGKAVGVAADCSGVKSLDIGAASSSMSVVDDVAGGKIKVCIDDFSYNVNSKVVSLGDLKIGGNFSVQARGDITMMGALTVQNADFHAGGVVSVANANNDFSGTINAQAGGIGTGMLGMKNTAIELVAQNDMKLGDISTDAGNVYAISKFGDVTVAEGKTVKSTANGALVNLVSAQGGYRYDQQGQLEFAKGDVVVEGTVESTGIGGRVALEAFGNNYTDAKTDALLGHSSGDVLVNGKVFAKKNVNISTGIGNVEFGLDARVSAGAVATETAEEVSGSIKILAGKAQDGTGSVVLKGEPAGGETRNGAEITAYGNSSTIDIASGYGVNAVGDIDIGGEVCAGCKSAEGTLLVGNVGGDVQIFAGYGNQKGTSGNLEISGNVVAGREIRAKTFDGDLSVEKDGTVFSCGSVGGVILRSGDKVQGKGDLTIDGYIGSFADSTQYVKGDETLSGGITLFAAGTQGSGKNDFKLGENGQIVMYGKGSLLQIATGIGDESQGDVSIDGSIFGYGANENIRIWSGYGKGSTGNLSMDGVIGTYGYGSGTKLWSGRGSGAAGDMTVNGTIFANGIGSYVYLFGSYGNASRGNVSVSGLITAPSAGGTVEVSTAHGNGASGKVDISGNIDAKARVFVGTAQGAKSAGSIVMSGHMTAGGYYDDDARAVKQTIGDDDGAYALLVAGVGDGSISSTILSGTMTSFGSKGGASFTGAYGEGAVADISILETGKMTGVGDAHILTQNGNVDLRGQLNAVSENGHAAIWSRARDENHGNISFDGGKVTATTSVDIYAEGDVKQSGNAVVNRQGIVDSCKLSPAIQAGTDDDKGEINFFVKGNLGSADSYVSVDGYVRGLVEKNAYVAAADGKNYLGNYENDSFVKDKISSFSVNIGAGDDKSGGASSQSKVVTLKAEVPNLNEQFDELGDAAFRANGDLSIYTAGKLEHNGTFYAGGDLTISAASFGDMSYLQAGGTLTINNVGKPAHPQIAYFESINGVEPQINNQPNDTVIFVDGRLAGGNLKILNQFGANEAFMVSTPELKSTQGIFGNPTFLHSDLDVANPMEVSAIDYMLQETPRLTLDKDFPPEVDSHVDSVVIPEKDSIQFGRGAKSESPAESDGKVVKAVSADGKIATLN